MIAMLAQLSQTPDATGPAGDLPALLAAVVILLLLSLLVQREIVACFPGPRAQIGRQALHVAIIPLLTVAALVVGLRLVSILDT